MVGLAQPVQGAGIVHATKTLTKAMYNINYLQHLADQFNVPQVAERGKDGCILLADPGPFLAEDLRKQLPMSKQGAPERDGAVSF